MNKRIRKLQKLASFREILKNQKIGWRMFAKYAAFGLIDYTTNTITVNMAKWNGKHDYQICRVTANCTAIM